MTRAALPSSDTASGGLGASTGFLYARRDLVAQLEPPFLDLHAATWTATDRYEIRADARRFENWETNCAGKIGLGTAVDYSLSWGMEAIEVRVTELAERLRQRLTSVPGVTVHDQGQRRRGIVTFTVDGITSQTVQESLSSKRVNVSVSLVDYARLDLPHRGLPDVVRASVHYYNTDDELAQLVDALPVANPTPHGP